MHATEFCEFVWAAKRGRMMMARIALNSLGHAKHYPVDVSVFRVLPPENRAMVNAFLDWNSQHPGFYLGIPHLWRMQGLVEGRFTDEP